MFPGLALFVLVGLLGAPVAAAQSTPGWARLQIAATGTYADRYLPASLVGEVAAGGPVPVIVFLHGTGAAPEDWQALLAPAAEARGAVLLLPRALSAWGFGVGRDDQTVHEALGLLGQELPIDPRRVSIAGHSSGGAFAYFLAYQSPARFAAVFALAAPFRPVLAVADPGYTAPARIYYGTADPNYTGGHYAAVRDLLSRLGVAAEYELAPGQGHGGVPAASLDQGFAFLLAQAYGTEGWCVPELTRLCLGSGRFGVEATWQDFQGGSGPGRVVPLQAADSGMLWFFAPANWELLVKVLDGCGLNGHFWVLAAATTNVAYTLVVTDHATGGVRSFENPLGRLSPAVADAAAFPCS